MCLCALQSRQKRPEVRDILFALELLPRAHCGGGRFAAFSAAHARWQLPGTRMKQHEGAGALYKQRCKGLQGRAAVEASSDFTSRDGRWHAMGSALGHCPFGVRDA